jgi:hypothetical protein
MKKIVVTISDDGETQVEAMGYRGSGCVKASDPLVKALLGETRNETKKPEFYQPEFNFLKERERQ